MKRNKYACLATIISLSAALVACGGGGGGAPGSPASTVISSELEGTWIAATDNNLTGTSCGLTSSGAPGERFTVTFNANRYTYTAENCLIISGNKGSYLLNSSTSGTFFIGDIVLASNDPSAQMRALDLISSTTVYTSYNLVSNKLHIALPFQNFDGTSRDKRAFQIATFYDPASRSLIVNPTFIRQ
jgi:hypothetical protein